MDFKYEEVYAVLRQFNPWWVDRSIEDLPPMKRVVFREIVDWVLNPPTDRAVLLTGARQVGKTTLFRQVIRELISIHGIDPKSIIYITFDHPLIKLAGIEKVLKIWERSLPKTNRDTILFLDEIQYIENWETWVKHQIDFFSNRRICITGSAIPLKETTLESGVGRIHTIKLPTFSFYEFLRIKNIQCDNIPDLSSLIELFEFDTASITDISGKSEFLEAYFHEYILKGGFPKISLIENISTAQKLLREDIIERILNRDMTTIFGVRKIPDLEKIFLYLCLHDGGIIDIKAMCNSLDVKRPTALDYLKILESSHLIYKLSPYGYGKNVLKAQHKVYLADPAISGSILLKGENLLEDPVRLGMAVETAFYKHVFSRFYKNIVVDFAYWKGKTNREVDIIAEVRNEIIPFEVKYRSDKIKGNDLMGLIELSKQKGIPRAYVITKAMNHFGEISENIVKNSETKFMMIPAPLACFWLSRAEHY